MVIIGFGSVVEGYLPGPEPYQFGYPLVKLPYARFARILLDDIFNHLVQTSVNCSAGNAMGLKLLGNEMPDGYLPLLLNQVARISQSAPSCREGQE